MAQSDIQTLFGTRLTRRELLTLRQRLRHHRGRVINDIAGLSASPPIAYREWKGRHTLPLTDQTSSGRRLKPALWNESLENQIEPLSKQPFYRHTGREIIIVRKGKLRVQFLGQSEAQACELKATDGAQQIIDFATDIPHRFEPIPDPSEDGPGFEAIIVSASDAPRTVQNAPYLEGTSDDQNKGGRLYRVLNKDRLQSNGKVPEAKGYPPAEWIAKAVKQYVDSVATYRARRVLLAAAIDELLSKSSMELFQFVNGPGDTKLGTVGFLALLDDLLMYAPIGHQDYGAVDGLQTSLKDFSQKLSEQSEIHLLDHEVVEHLQKSCETHGEETLQEVIEYIKLRGQGGKVSLELLRDFRDGKDISIDDKRVVLHLVRGFFAVNQLQHDVEIIQAEIASLSKLGHCLSYKHLSLMIPQQCQAYGLSNEELASLANSTTYWQNLRNMCDLVFLRTHLDDLERKFKTDLGGIAEVFDIDVDELFMIPLAIKGRSYDTYSLAELKEAASDDLERNSHTGTGAQYSEIGRYRSGDGLSAYLVKITDKPDHVVSCVTHPDEDEFDLVLEGRVRAHYDLCEPHDAVMAQGDDDPVWEGDHQVFSRIEENYSIFLAAGESHAWSKVEDTDGDPLVLTIVSTARHGTARGLHTAPPKKGEVFENTHQSPERARQRWMVTADSVRARFGSNARPGDAIVIHHADLPLVTPGMDSEEENTLDHEEMKKRIRALNAALREEGRFDGMNTYSEQFVTVKNCDDSEVRLPSRVCDVMSQLQAPGNRSKSLLVVIYPQISKQELVRKNAPIMRQTLVDLLGADRTDLPYPAGRRIPAEQVLYWVRATEVNGVFPDKAYSEHNEKWHLLEPGDFVIRTNFKNLMQMHCEANKHMELPGGTDE